MLHSFGMVDVEVIETEDTHGYLKHGRKLICGKNHQHQLLGNMMFKQTCLKSSMGLLFAKTPYEESS